MHADKTEAVNKCYKSQGRLHQSIELQSILRCNEKQKLFLPGAGVLLSFLPLTI